MPICPHCETRIDVLLAPCPNEDGYHGVDERDFAAFKGDSLIGKSISDRYVITGVIGRGAIGRVYKGRQLNVDRDVVLKLFKLDNLLEDELGYNPSKTIIEARADARERFVREARVLGQLTHPNCVTLYDFGLSDDGALLYIAMELVAGVSLRQALRRGLKSAATVEIMHQILQALRQAHALDIVHRDLKPENIILSFRTESNEPVVKVLDFGIAKLVGKDVGDSAHTSAGMLFGTPAYMSPEQCRGITAEIGPPADIYAIGCLFFELVTGALPFPGRSPQQMIMMHQEQPVPSVHPRQGLEIPTGVDVFIKKCLAKKPQDRYPNAREALRVFSALVDEWEGPALSDTRDASTFAEVHALRERSQQLAGSSSELPIAQDLLRDGVTNTAHGETFENLPLSPHEIESLPGVPHAVALSPRRPSSQQSAHPDIHATLTGASSRLGGVRGSGGARQSAVVLIAALVIVALSCVALIYFMYVYI